MAGPRQRVCRGPGATACARGRTSASTAGGLELVHPGVEHQLTLAHVAQQLFRGELLHLLRQAPRPALRSPAVPPVLQCALPMPAARAPAGRRGREGVRLHANVVGGAPWRFLRRTRHARRCVRVRRARGHCADRGTHPGRQRKGEAREGAGHRSAGGSCSQGRRTRAHRQVCGAAVASDDVSEVEVCRPHLHPLGLSAVRGASSQARPRVPARTRARPTPPVCCCYWAPAGAARRRGRRARRRPLRPPPPPRGGTAASPPAAAGGPSAASPASLAGAGSAASRARRRRPPAARRWSQSGAPRTCPTAPRSLPQRAAGTCRRPQLSTASRRSRARTPAEPACGLSPGASGKNTSKNRHGPHGPGTSKKKQAPHAWGQPPFSAQAESEERQRGA